MAGPLTGIRVLDLSRVLAGPWCTMILADLGAEVIKIEEPKVGESMRRAGGARIADEPVDFLYYNRNKQGMSVNLKHPEGQAIALELARSSDVLIQNFRTQFVKLIGLDYDTMKTHNHGIIYCSITAFGESGPYGDEGGGDLNAIGLAGIMSLTGSPDGPPMRPGLAVADLMTGNFAAIGILAALREREHTGHGQKVSVNLLDTSIAALGQHAGWYFATGSSPGRYYPTIGPGYEPTGVYRTADDRHINVGASLWNWTKACRALGLEHLIDDPRVKTTQAREKHGAELRQVFARVIATKTAQEWLERLRAEDVNCSPVNTVEEALDDPQVVHNRMVIEVEHQTGDVMKMLRCPLQLSEHPMLPQDSLPPPTLGQHTEEILRTRLNKTAEDVEQLRANGVI